MIRHLGRYYDIIAKDVNEKEIAGHSYDIEDIKESNEKMWNVILKL